MQNSLVMKLLIVAVALALTAASCPCDTDCSIITQQLPSGRAGQQYSAALEATYTSKNCESQTSPVISTWRLADGTLPPGLQLSRDGVVSGIPTSPGTFRATFAAKCQGGYGGPTKALDLTVTP